MTSNEEAGEAARIVAWLRTEGKPKGETASWAHHFADAIERGDWRSTPIPTVNGTDEPPNAGEPITYLRNDTPVSTEFRDRLDAAMSALRKEETDEPPNAILAGVIPSDAGRTADDIRAAGWVVAIHNDYRLNGEPHTFWLFTKDSRCVKGEGRTDAEALDQVARALREAGGRVTASNCFECDTPLVGPICPQCNPAAGRVELVERED